MSPRRSRSEARSERRKKTPRNDRALLQLVEHEQAARTKIRKRKGASEVTPKTKNQARYDQAISANTITFGTGVAGTGKTWWAAMRAAKAFESGEFEKIIITRPAIEAGESLGFLPGETEEKFDPYFRPVYDALAGFLGGGQLEYALKSGQIEARPLAYLRGATFKETGKFAAIDAFVEAHKDDQPTLWEAWNMGNTVVRDSMLISQFAPQFGIDAAERDALLIAAAALSS